MDSGIIGGIFLLLVFLAPLGYAWFLKKKEKQFKEKIYHYEIDLRNKDKDIEGLKPKVEKYDEYANLQDLISSENINLNNLKQAYSEIQLKIDPYVKHLELADTGFFRFQYKFEDVDKYAEALQLVKDAQKVLIRNTQAVETRIPDFTSSNIYKGLSSLALLAFNSESETLIRKVTYSNFESCKAKIIELYDLINKHLSPVNMSISRSYLDLKIRELTIGFEHEDEKRRISEEQAEIAAQMREEESARVEAEQARLKAVEEEEKYQKALEEALKEIEGKTEQEREQMLSKIQELESKLQEAHLERERATSMAQITKAGHVYIISNIGSFGENVYKIGMTRRKDPIDRVKELSDASVPFQFDIHAMVYTENAPELENSLHRHFGEKRLNKINLRKEFFQVSLEEIEVACASLGLKIKLTRSAEAREYRETMLLSEEKQAA